MWMLSKYFAELNVRDSLEVILFAVALVGLVGLLRASEFISKAPYGCTLRRSHFSDLGDRVVLRLVRSKTDTFEEGVDVSIFQVGGPLCPVAWLRTLWAQSAIKSPEAPLFQSPDGSAITYLQLQAFLKRVCAATGVDGQRVTTHSLRIGGATTLFELGFSPDMVKKLGRWVSDSYQRYQRLSDASLRRAALAFAKTASSREHGMVGSQTVPEACSTSSSSLDACSSRLSSVSRKRHPPQKFKDYV
jgi:hypothetical protein